MAWRFRNNKPLRKLRDAKIALNNRSEYLQLKYMDIYSLAKAEKTKHRQQLFMIRAQKVQQLANNSLENAFIIEGLIDSINSLNIMINTDVQKILKGLCTAAIEDAMAKASSAMDSARDITDIVAEPLVTTELIDDEDLQQFIDNEDEGFKDTQDVIKEYPHIYHQGFPLPPNTLPIATKNDGSSMSINRRVNLDHPLDTFNLEAI